jgi:hypothetical protein
LISLISQLDIEALELNTGKERWRKFCEKQEQEKEENKRRQKAGRERWLMLLRSNGRSTLGQSRVWKIALFFLLRTMLSTTNIDICFMRDYDQKEWARKYRIDLGFMGQTCFCGVVAVWGRGFFSKDLN